MLVCRTGCLRSLPPFVRPGRDPAMRARSGTILNNSRRSSEWVKSRIWKGTSFKGQSSHAARAGWGRVLTRGHVFRCGRRRLRSRRSEQIFLRMGCGRLSKQACKPLKFGAIADRKRRHQMWHPFAPTPGPHRPAAHDARSIGSQRDVRSLPVAGKRSLDSQQKRLAAIDLSPGWRLKVVIFGH